MTTENQNDQQQLTEHKKGNPPRYKNAIDRINRRERRNDFRTKYNNDRKPKNSGFLQMGLGWDGSALYRPNRGKLKGWQKNLKKIKNNT